MLSLVLIKIVIGLLGATFHFCTWVTNGRITSLRASAPAAASSFFKLWTNHWVFSSHDRSFRDLAVDFLSYEWHDWVKETQDLIQGVKNRTSDTFRPHCRCKNASLVNSTYQSANSSQMKLAEGCDQPHPNSNLSKFSVTFRSFRWGLWRVKRSVTLPAWPATTFTFISRTYIQGQTFIVHEDVSERYSDLVSRGSMTHPFSRKETHVLP